MSKEFEHHCFRCGLDWSNHIESPAKCKGCGNFNYDQEDHQRNAPGKSPAQRQAYQPNVARTFSSGTYMSHSRRIL